MTTRPFLIAAFFSLTLVIKAQESKDEPKTIVFDTFAARLVIDTRGGAIGEFRLKKSDVNPLNWGAPGLSEFAPHGFGHFLCLDRWGPPSKAEGEHGMPYHGEASNVRWTVQQAPINTNGMMEAIMSAKLPKAGFSVRRTIRMSPQNTVFTVREEITNDKDLGRIFNIVQHPTIAPPFLDETTTVSCNAGRGFAQADTADPETSTTQWPEALKKDGQKVDLRRMSSDSEPNVVSYVADGKYGWVIAANPSKSFLIGYIWLAADYPWISLWRDVHDGKPAARGLEFGSTGLHQPFPALVKKGRILDRQLFEYIDAGQTIARRYTAFLMNIPPNFSGIDSAAVDGEFLHLKNHQMGREWIISLRGATLE
jgi:hypothetical protein